MSSSADPAGPCTARPGPVVVVMGVSGSGKSTVAALLADRLGWDRQEGDDLHPRANVAKMAAGIPLTDDDRWPWLDRVAAWIHAQRAAGRPGVITCSALRRRYRDRLRGDGVVFVLLAGRRAAIAERLAARRAHFMPAGLLDSQLATLEPPTADENALVVDTDATPTEIADDVVRRLEGARAMPTAPPSSAVLAGLDDLRGALEDFYRDLHRHPELSHQEQRTAAAVADRLEQAGYAVHRGVGGTGVVGVLANGEGPTVLLRADMDALPVREATGLPYASTETATDADGAQVPVMHACGHDVHVTCLLGAARLLAEHTDAWHGTLVALFQPAEETGDGARGMVDDELAGLLPRVDAALAQHVLPFPAGLVGTRPGPVLSAADSMRITVHGRGAHGSMPQAAVDPVVLAAMIVVRLQTVVAREVAPTETAVLTVGAVQAGSKSNVIPDSAQLLLNVRTYHDATRTAVLDAIRRIVTAECQASGTPKDPEFELFDRFPLTENDPDTTERVAAAFTDFFADRAGPIPAQSASEDFSDIPRALGVPYTYWGIGGVDADTYRRAAEAGRVSQDIPVNHSAAFAPVIQPTLDTGVQALVVAALAWLA